MKNINKGRVLARARKFIKEYRSAVIKTANSSKENEILGNIEAEDVIKEKFLMYIEKRLSD